MLHLAPLLLFAFSLILLIRILDDKEAEGKIKRLKISNKNIFFYQIFAHDTYITLQTTHENFFEVQKIIEKYA